MQLCVYNSKMFNVTLFLLKIKKVPFMVVNNLGLHSVLVLLYVSIAMLKLQSTCDVALYLTYAYAAFI